MDSVTEAEALSHVFDVIGIDDETAAYLIENHINTVRELVTTSESIYKAIADADDSVLHHVDAGQLIVFQSWCMDEGPEDYHPVTIVDQFTSSSWSSFGKRYVASQLLVQTVQAGARAYCPQPLPPKTDLKRIQERKEALEVARTATASTDTIIVRPTETIDSAISSTEKRCVLDIAGPSPAGNRDQNVDQKSGSELRTEAGTKSLTGALAPLTTERQARHCLRGAIQGVPQD